MAGVAADLGVLGELGEGGVDAGLDVGAGQGGATAAAIARAPSGSGPFIRP